MAWENLPSTNTPLNATNLNQFEKYSTTETVIGTWINGKPLYRKVISVPVASLVGGTTLRVSHGISNVEFITNAHGIFKRNDGEINLMPNNYTNWEAYLYDFDTGGFAVRLTANQVNIGITEMYVVIEYTKTTD